MLSTLDKLSLSARTKSESGIDRELTSLQKSTLPMRTKSESGVNEDQTVLLTTEENISQNVIEDSDTSDTSADLSDWARTRYSRCHPRRLTPLSPYAAGRIATRLLALGTENSGIIAQTTEVVGVDTSNLNTEKNQKTDQNQERAGANASDLITEKNGEKTNQGTEVRGSVSSATSTTKKNSKKNEGTSNEDEKDTSSSISTSVMKEIKAEWKDLFTDLTEIGREMKMVRSKEKELYEEIDNFLLRYGKVGEDLAADSLPCIKDRREERAFLTAFRKERRARRQRENEEVRWAWQEIKYVVSHRRQIEEEERRAQLRLMRVYREEERARNKLKWTEQHLKMEDIRESRPKDACLICDYPGVKSPAKCPEQQLHNEYLDDNW